VTTADVNGDGKLDLIVADYQGGVAVLQNMSTMAVSLDLTTVPIATGADTGLVIDTVSCFATGTRLAIPGGLQTVETLAVGDLLLTESGAARPAIWIGRREVDCARHAYPETVWPVLVKANAFGPSLPRIDLVLSPEHAVHIADVLIPIRNLIDGINIVQIPTDHITYWHVELATHDVLLAEGLPCESFLDNGQRGAYATPCAPLRTQGPHVERARALIREAA
jgi:hypothetical protein